MTNNQTNGEIPGDDKSALIAQLTPKPTVEERRYARIMDITRERLAGLSELSADDHRYYLAEAAEIGRQRDALRDEFIAEYGGAGGSGPMESMIARKQRTGDWWPDNWPEGLRVEVAEWCKTRGAGERWQHPDDMPSDHADWCDGCNYCCDGALETWNRRGSLTEPKPVPEVAVAADYEDSDTGTWYDRKVTPPDLLETAEGDFLIQSGKLTTIYGEWGSGKSWVAAILASQWLEVEDNCLVWVDYEDQPAELAERLSMLGTDVEHSIEYCATLEETSWMLRQGDLRDHLIVVDALTGLMGELGASQGAGNDTDAVDRAISRLRAYTRLGATVVVLDHANRSGDALGSQRKMSAVDVAIELQKGKAFDRETDGHSVLVPRKSRTGHLKIGQPCAYLECASGEIQLTSELTGTSGTRTTNKKCAAGCGTPVSRAGRTCKTCSAKARKRGSDGQF